jgi:hypothetical protein
MVDPSRSEASRGGKSKAGNEDQGDYGLDEEIPHEVGVVTSTSPTMV